MCLSGFRGRFDVLRSLVNALARGIISEWDSNRERQTGGENLSPTVGVNNARQS